MINFTHLQQEQFLPSYRTEEFVSKTDDRFKKFTAVDGDWTREY